MEKANLSTIYLNNQIWCQEVWPEDVKKYVELAKKENPNKKINVSTKFQNIYSETEIENMTDEDKAIYLA